MKLLAFVGSPRKGSNVEILIDKVIEGVHSKISASVKKIYLYKANIQLCTGCLACTALKGGKPCPLKDDMPRILTAMEQADGFIFGPPNHVHSMSAAMVNLFCRMQPLIKMSVERDSVGNIIGATSSTTISGKRAVVVVSQGDFSPCQSALLLRVLDSNIKDFKLVKVAEILSTGNLERAQVKDKAYDLQQAFEAGVRLAGVK
ncbi:MAG: flavodoxin family protein [Desulfobacterota bacterium]|nr:flavodoxin family protein [Thermodesulfobacteriota bacterium]